MEKLLQLDVSNPDFCSLFYFPGLMEIRSVSVGVVAIKSVSTGLYLAMSKKGTLFGSVRIQPGNIVSGGQEGSVWEGKRAFEGYQISTYPNMFDSVELKRNLRNLLLGSPEKGQSVIINHGCTPGPWLMIPAASVGLFHCQNR